ncbi:hypothetical protein [Paenibacillus sp. Marseille-Q7038]
MSFLKKLFNGDKDEDRKKYEEIDETFKKHLLWLFDADKEEVGIITISEYIINLFVPKGYSDMAEMNLVDTLNKLAEKHDLDELDMMTYLTHMLNELAQCLEVKMV